MLHRVYSSAISLSGKGILLLSAIKKKNKPNKKEKKAEVKCFMRRWPGAERAPADDVAQAQVDYAREALL